jgi:hypothetical protein
MKGWALLLLGLVMSALAILPVIASAQSTKIHISAPSKSLSWFPIHFTREKSFYRAEGLDVDYVIMRPQIAMQALIAGDVGYHSARFDTARGVSQRARARGHDHRR